MQKYFKTPWIKAESQSHKNYIFVLNIVEGSVQMTLDSTERLTIMRQNTGVNVEESCCKENFVLSVLYCGLLLENYCI